MRRTLGSAVKWLSTAVLVAVALGWGPSSRWGYLVCFPRADIAFSAGNGQLRLTRSVVSTTTSPAAQRFCVLYVHSYADEDFGWYLPGILHFSSGVWRMVIPFWLLAVASGGPAVWLWRAALRKSRAAPGALPPAVLPMPLPQLGDGLRPTRRATCAVLIALGVVGFDLLLVPPEAWRLVLALGAAGLLLWLAQGNRQTLGLQVRPVQPIWYWARLTAGLGVLVLLLTGVALNLAWLTDCPLMPSGGMPPAYFRGWVWHACVVAPLVEESLYRLVLCPAVAAAAGRWTAIVASGVVFAALHFRYGNAGPDNFVAGYILGWAYFRSRSIAVPVALHALGNLVVGLGQVALWSVQPG